MRIYEPLKENHPLVVDQDRCWICGAPFVEGQRTTLIPIETPEQSGSLTCEAKVAHASCRYVGKTVNNPSGGEATVTQIKDGDAAPYPVVVKDEAGIDRQWYVCEIEKANPGIE